MDKLKITDIQIGKRARVDYGDIEGLAASMNRNGQLQPIIVDEKGELIAGERRLKAAMSLGWDEIEVKYKVDLTEVEKREIELEENLRRKEFNWPEEVLAIERLYKMKQERYGTNIVRGGAAELLSDDKGYSYADLSEELEKHKSQISMDLTLAQALHEYPEQLLQEKSKAAALRRYKTLKETDLRRAQAARTRDKPVITETQANGEATEAKDESGSQATPGASEVRRATFKGRGVIYYGDSRQVLQSVPEDAIDCVVTDPPFALGMFREGESTSNRRLADNAGHMYDDDPHRVLDVIDQVIAQCARVLKPEGHAYVFFHFNLYQQVLDILERHWPDKVVASPIIWVKNTPGIGNPNLNWVYAYEPCFFVNGGRSLVKPQTFNYIRCDTVPPKNKIHPTEKPTMLLRHIIGASCVEGEVVLDPFAGSGSTLSAAVQQGCKFVGIEQQEEFYTKILNRLQMDIGEVESNELADAELSGATASDAMQS